MAMEARLKDLQDRKFGSAIHVAGYTFKDQKTTDVWALTLGNDDVILLQRCKGSAIRFVYSSED